MISLDEAINRIESQVVPLQATALSLNDAVGCVLAEDMISPIDVPGFVSSAMDGIAIRSTDIKGNGPWRFRVEGTVAAGKPRTEPLTAGCAVKILTGACLPEGADTVVPVEDVKFESGNAVISERPPANEFVRPAGDDIKAGHKIYAKGTVLKPVDAGVLASLGMTSVKVIPRPGIGLFSTGRELRKPGEHLEAGQIYDSNYAVLRALLVSDGYRTVGAASAIPDDPKAVAEALQQASQTCQAVITTGGVSMGDYDYIPQGVKMLNGDILFHKVAIKPGKPVLIARIGGNWLVALPGNPVSAVVGYHLFARRVIGLLMGKLYSARKAMATLGSELEIKGNRFCIVGAKLEETANGLIAYPSQRQKSGRLTSIAGIDGFVFVEGGSKTLEANSEVYVEWL